jgi:hypothetical protein
VATEKLKPRWLTSERTQRLRVAVLIYVITTAVYFACASRSTLTTHTPWNHYALLAQSWLSGRLDLGGPPPAYAGNNDFAHYGTKWFVIFPPFPAVLLVPLVAFAGDAEAVRDGQFFLWLAGIGPAVLFLVFEKFRRMGLSHCPVRTHALLALLFAFGTVYFFSAEQGTVWFAAHVVAVALAAAYLLFALDAERPVLAGTLLGFAFATRPPLAFAGVLFLLETWRLARRRETPAAPPSGQLELALGASSLTAAAEPGRRDHLTRLALFAAPLLVIVGLLGWYNRARFGSALDSGYQYLVVAWRPRIERWGLFGYHYLARNLGLLLTGLPYLADKGGRVPFQINGHGLALWFTTPLYLWLLWPRRFGPIHRALWITVLCVALPTLLYQNSGWLQFGQRFSNDYAVFLFALICIGGYRYGTLFRVAAAWSVIVNAFGALTFGRGDFTRFYYQDNSQKTIYQPD